jgi:DNA-binding NarL/FixJ family response regulator
VTERTVKAHCQEVFDRLGARNRTAAVAAAMRMGLFMDE